jgi:hypothetical protein
MTAWGSGGRFGVSATAIRRRRVPSPAALKHPAAICGLHPALARPCQWIPKLPRISSGVAWQGCIPGDPHCALRVWVQRRWGSTSRQLDPDRFGGQPRRNPSHEYPASSGMWPLPAASGCIGLTATRTASDRVTRGRRLFSLVWQVLGSNQRRLSRRFYRPLPLATRATCRVRSAGGHRKDSPRRDRTVSGIRLSG